MATKQASSRLFAERKVTARMADLQKKARHAAGLLKAMSNPSRLIILCQLAEGERSVGALERAVGLSQSGISQHLAVLRRQSVVTSRRVHQTVFYSLASDDVVTIMATLHDVFCRKGAQSRAPGRQSLRHVVTASSRQ